MRKLMIIPLAGVLLLGAAAPVAAGPNTSNISGSGRTIQGEWYTDTSYGAVYLFDESGGTYGELFEESGQYVACNANEESYGFQGTRVFGWANDLTITIDKKLTTGSAAGDFELVVETIDECAGTSEVDFESADVSVDVTGVGSIATFKNRGSFKIPGEYNSHGRYRGSERQAEGEIDLGSMGSRVFGWAILSAYSWSDHTNG